MNKSYHYSANNEESDTECGTETEIDETQESESEEEEEYNPYFQDLIKKVVDLNPEYTRKRVYKTLLKKAKHYYSQCSQMKQDKLWEKIEEDLDLNEDDNKDAGASAGACFEIAIKKYKPIVMDMIKDVIDQKESEEDEEEDDDVSIDDVQIGTGRNRFDVMYR